MSEAALSCQALGVVKARYRQSSLIMIDLDVFTASGCVKHSVSMLTSAGAEKGAFKCIRLMLSVVSSEAPCKVLTCCYAY